MLKIVICDDLDAEAQALKDQIERYAAANGISAEIKTYSEEQSVLAVLKHAAEYDLLFLDIYMQQINGIELARQLREQGDKSRIIFFSTSTEHALEAFGVNASQYLVKPVEYDKLANAIDMVLEQRREKQVFITIASRNGIAKIMLEDFVYAETQQHYQYIHLIGSEPEKTRMAGAELYRLLEGREEFARLGASYIVNLKYVVRISAKDVELIDGSRLPMPRSSYAQFRQKYMSYFMTGGMP